MSWSTSSDRCRGSGSSATNSQSFRHSSSFSFFLDVMKNLRQADCQIRRPDGWQLGRPNRSQHKTYTSTLTEQECKLYENIARLIGTPAFAGSLRVPLRNVLYREQE